jgi:prephenate dehydrogenase
MAVRIGLLGYGKFGGALAGLLEEGGVRYRALDPAAAVPAECRAGSLDELVDGADFVALAVPIRALPGALEAVAPRLAPEQVLFDVASVKMLPAQWMEERLGSQPRAGVHPLFGPVSLARAERPLRTVVCALPGQDAAARRVTGLFQELGCEVLAQTPEEHDRVMAATHALTFFLAKGLLEVGAGADLPFAPPSFHAIQRTLDSVREDAGHLFSGIQNFNPFAAEARAGLLRALHAIDDGLGAGGEGGELPERLAIPGLEQPPPALLETRELIDDLDRELLALLGRRAELSRRAGRAKAAVGAPVRDPAREARLVQDRRRWAAEAGLDPDTVLEVFQAVLRGSRRTQGQDR